MLTTTEHGRTRCPRAFTLIELLIVIMMIAVLLGIVLPVLGRTLESGRAFKCRMALRGVAMDFLTYADEQLHADRGNDELLPGDRFYLESFQESQYGIDEFWAWGAANEHLIPDAAGNNPMHCPSVRGEIKLKKNLACANGGVSPSENVSFGFNARLHRPEVVNDNGQIKAVKTSLSFRILEEGAVPLVWDVDGRVAKEKGVNPVFSAPAMDSQAVYANDKHWFPGTRHNGSMNIAFVDTHVDSTMRPLQDVAEGAWSFQPID